MGGPRPRPRALLALVALAAVVSLAACGDDGSDGSDADSGDTTEISVSGAVGKESSGRSKFKIGAITTAPSEDQQVSRLQVDDAQTIDQWLTAVLNNVHTYWTGVFAANKLPPPAVRYLWLAPGTKYQTLCRKANKEPEIADDGALYYCPADDTIYISQVAAADLWSGEGPLQEWQAGDFGLAYGLSHEYGHNVQLELKKSGTVHAEELQADCYSGNWGSNAYFQGLLDPGDPEEGINTAYDLGSFDATKPGFHGTPEERATAWLKGYNTGDPVACASYLP